MTFEPMAGEATATAGETALCRTVVDNLGIFLDEELDERAHAIVADHLETCPACSDAADLAERMRSVVKRACSESAPSSLHQRIQARIVELRAEMGN
jgi:mycothiol system anti-sigma-R factor